MGYKQQLEELQEFVKEWDEELEEQEEILEVTPELLAEQERDVRRTGRVLYVGIFIFCMLFLLVGNLLMRGSFSFTVGLLLGTLVAAVMAAHMQYTIRRAVEMESKAAGGYTKKSALLRMLLMILALLAAVALPEVFHFVGVMLGVLTLKGAVLIYPVTDKILFNKGE